MDVLQANLIAAWAGIVLGMGSGALLGLGFARDGWLGGYDAWPRRLLRVGHISFFGIAFLNLAFVGTAAIAGTGTWSDVAGSLLLFGAAAMPTTCALAAMNRRVRWLFAAPVSALLGGAGITLTACVLVAMGGGS